MKNKKLTTYQLSVTALMAAVMCVLGPVSVPIGPVPLSLTNLVIFFAVYLLGAKLGALSVLVYLVLGAVGLPVFSGYAGGLAKLAGPTGGYLVGFVPMAFVIGLFVEQADRLEARALRPVLEVAGFLLGEAVLYVIGTAWFVVLMDCTVSYALGICVVPFLPGDAAKIVLAVVFGALLRRRLIQARVLKNA